MMHYIILLYIECIDIGLHIYIYIFIYIYTDADIDIWCTLGLHINMVYIHCFILV